MDTFNDMFPAYGGKCLTRKAVHSWVEESGERFADDEEVEMERRKKRIKHSRYLRVPVGHLPKAGL